MTRPRLKPSNYFVLACMAVWLVLALLSSVLPGVVYIWFVFVISPVCLVVVHFLERRES